jgi:hypothetical protein
MQSNCGAKRYSMYLNEPVFRIVTAHKVADCKKYMDPAWESYHHRLIHYSTCIRSRVLADFLFQAYNTFSMTFHLIQKSSW